MHRLIAVLSLLILSGCATREWKGGDVAELRVVPSEIIMGLSDTQCLTVFGGNGVYEFILGLNETHVVMFSDGCLEAVATGEFSVVVVSKVGLSRRGRVVNGKVN